MRKIKSTLNCLKNQILQNIVQAKYNPFTVFHIHISAFIAQMGTSKLFSK